MLNSCAPGVAVLNIDNGFGAAFAAHRVNMPMARAKRCQTKKLAKTKSARAKSSSKKRNGKR